MIIRAQYRKFSALVPIVLCLMLWLAGLLSDRLNRVEYPFYDWLIGISQPKVYPDIVIIGVDQDSLDKVGSWPWPRELHAFLLEHLSSGRVVGLDILFTEASLATPQSDIALANAIKHNGKVVLPVIKKNPTDILPILKDAAANTGYVDIPRDSDNLIRRIQTQDSSFISNTDPNELMSFSQAMIKTAHIQPVKSTYHFRDLLAQANTSNQWFIPYSNAEHDFPIVPYHEVLEGKHKHLFDDKMVFVGTIASHMGDRHLTPSNTFSGSLPGIYLLANITNATINNSMILLAPTALQAGIGLFIFAFIAFFSRRLKIDSIYFYLFIALILMIFSAFMLAYLKIWIPTTALALSIILLGVIKTFIQRSQFKTMALTDSLTNLSNRHDFKIKFEYLRKSSMQRREYLCFLLLDIDFFKKYNDIYGHQAGDSALIQIGKVLNQLRKHDEIAARLGGEEFAFIIPNCNYEKAATRADQIRQAILDLKIEHTGNPSNMVSVSIGMVCAIASHEYDERAYYQSADIALYKAKRQGRNQVQSRPIEYSK